MKTQRITYTFPITFLKPNEIFVFGSNTQGRHGKGTSLLAARRFGAIHGISRGMQGKSYAICTKDLTSKVHPSISQEEIMEQIDKLYQFAIINSDLNFVVAYSVGANLNEYTPKQMAKMFYREDIPENIIFEERFSKLVFKN